MMKKRLLSAALASALLISLAGCGGTAASSKTSSASASGAASSAAPAKKTVVEIWTNDRHDLDYVTKKIEAFNASNPDNIEIQQTVVTDDYINMLSMARSSGTAPDLAFINGGASGFDLKLFADSGILSPLNDYIKSAPAEFERNTEISKHVFEGLNAIDGKVYWVPTAGRSGTRIIYNKSLTDAAGMKEFPKTLDEMVALAKTITTNGKGAYYGFATTSSDPFVRCFQGVAEKSGQNSFGYDYVNGKFDFSGFKPVVEGFQKMFKDGSVLPGSSTQGVDAMRAQFADGAVGLWANASQEAGVFTTQFPISKFEWGVAEIPTLDGSVHGAQSAQPQKGLMMLSDTDVPDAAWKVIQFFASEDFLKGYCEGGFALPFSDYINSVVDHSKGGRIADFGKKSYESVYPSAPSVTLEGEDRKAVLMSAVLGERNVDDAIKDLNTRYNAALENDVKMGKIKRLVIADYDPMNPSGGTLTYLDH